MNNSPCKDCNNKGCGSFHDTCEIYQEFRNQQQKDYKEKVKYKEYAKINKESKNRQYSRYLPPNIPLKRRKRGEIHA